MTGIVTRFAPSPTGYLHIGSARTALFNWLFARHHGGKYHLRIEDTDRERSTQSAVDALINGLSWLGLDWDGDVVFQFARSSRHAEVARSMVSSGHAYYCTCSAEAVEAMREKCRASGLPPRYDGTCREKGLSGAEPSVVRLKMPQDGSQIVEDLVQGSVEVANKQLDDLILLRTDGTPTYMLSVVVDDYDMGVTHIIRGDDHLTNTFRQMAIYSSMGWPMPKFAHIPLIHGPDGAKLSKRHGALGVEAYKEMGYLPQALCNYLTRLGWSHGDDEIFSRHQAIEWFNLESIGKSPSRFDFAKLASLNGHYIRQTANNELIGLLEESCGEPFDAEFKGRLLQGMDSLKQRAKTLLELLDNIEIYRNILPLNFDDKAKHVLDESALALLRGVYDTISEIDDWSEESLEVALRQKASDMDEKFGAIAQPLRAAVTGKAVSPGVFEVMHILGKDITLVRLINVLN